MSDACFVIEYEECVTWQCMCVHIISCFLSYFSLSPSESSVFDLLLLLFASLKLFTRLCFSIMLFTCSYCSVMCQSCPAECLTGKLSRHCNWTFCEWQMLVINIALYIQICSVIMSFRGSSLEMSAWLILRLLSCKAKIRSVVKHQTSLPWDHSDRAAFAGYAIMIRKI